MAGETAPGSATWLRAGSSWFCVSGTFTFTVRQFCLICSAGRDRGRPHSGTSGACSNGSLRSKRVGRVPQLFAKRAPCASPVEAMPTDTEADLSSWSSHGDDTRERKTFWCPSRWKRRGRARLPPEQRENGMQTAARFDQLPVLMLQASGISKVPLAKPSGGSGNAPWNDCKECAVFFST